MLMYRYQIQEVEAACLSDFLMKILKWHPRDRPTAEEMLDHPWLKMADNYSYKMTEMEFKLFELKDQARYVDTNEPEYAELMEQKANLMNQGQN